MAANSQEKWISCFNSKFEEFIKDMISIYPNDKDFKMMKNSFSLLKMADEKKPVALFAKFGNKFEKPVKEKNEDFFLNRSYDDVADESNFTDGLINKLKDYWKELSAENKDIVWNYLNLFFTLKTKIKA